ncbi:MAG: TRAP transporter small permease subunit [Rubrimonas sp.]
MTAGLRWLWKVVDALMALLLAFMIVIVFANVVLRYGFATGLRQSVELSRLALVWLVMLGAAVVLRRGEHLAVSEFAEAFLPRAVPLLRRLSHVVILVSVLMLFWGAFRQMNANWANISPLTGLPSALMYLAGVVSSVLMGFIALVRIVDPAALTAQDDRE